MTDGLADAVAEAVLGDLLDLDLRPPRRRHQVRDGAPEDIWSRGSIRLRGHPVSVCVGP